MKLSGIVVPNVTPMDASGERLDLASAQRLVEFYIEQNVGALFVNGTTGEGPLLSLQERKDHVDAVMEAASGRIQVAVHVGALTTTESIELAQHAQKVGADAIASITPYYFGYTDRELELFYRKLAQAVPGLDVYLYSLPARAGNTVSPSLAERLASETNIVGIKDSSGSIGQILELLAIQDFDVLPGADLLAIPALEAGAAGMVSGPAGIFPEPYVALWKAWKEKDHASVVSWQGVIRIISRAVHHGGRIDVLKALADLRLQGIGAVRSPLSQPEEKEFRAIRDNLYAQLSTTSLAAESYEWLR